MKLLLIIFVFYSTNLLAAIPTAESLFRNGNNKDLSGNFVVLKFSMQEIPFVEDESLVSDSETVLNEKKMLALEKYPLKHVKFIFSLEDETRVQLLQGIYSDSAMKLNALVSTNYFENIIEVMSEDVRVERSLLYSLVVMFALNDSSGIANVLKSHNQKFVSNKNLLNIEKKNLLEKYREYLVAIKADKKLKDELVSPLKPESPTEKAKVAEIMSSRMYSKAGDVSLVRKKKKFYWQVAYENFKAFFNHETHRLSRLNLTTEAGSFEGRFGDYILFDGIHELPKIAIIKTFADRKFKIRMLYLREFTNKGKKLKARAKDYAKKLRKPKQRSYSLPISLENNDKPVDEFFYR